MPSIAFLITNLILVGLKKIQKTEYPLAFCVSVSLFMFQITPNIS